MIPTQFPFNSSVWLLQKALRSWSMTVGFPKFNQMVLLLPTMIPEVSSLLEQPNTIPGTWSYDLANVFFLSHLN